MSEQYISLKNLKVLVTGGAGFLGKAIVSELLDPGSPIKFDELRILDIADDPGYHDDRVHYTKGDVCNNETVLEVTRDIDLVIHSAAVVDWGTMKDEEVIRINYGGTVNMVEASKANKVKYMVYTSSLDAVYSGKPLVNVNETLDYPEEHVTAYCKSKSMAEKFVLKSNNNDFKRCVLRPSDIFGEGDPYHIGSLVDMAKGGFYVRLGNGKSKCQHIYVGNMAHAHVLAAKALIEGNQKVVGSVYFITDGPSVNFFKFFDKIVEGAGYSIWPKNLWIPRGLAYTMGSISEFIAILMRPFKYYHPKFSRFAVTYTCTDYTFTSEKAKQDFGFLPKYSHEEAFDRTVAFFKKKD